MNETTTTILTEQDRDDLCICATRNQHEDAPSSACPLLAGKAIERIIARHLGIHDSNGACWCEPTTERVP